MTQHLGTPARFIRSVPLVLLTAAAIMAFGTFSHTGKVRSDPLPAQVKAAIAQQQAANCSGQPDK